MVQLSRLLVVAAACLAAPAIAHPGEHHDPDVVRREIHARDAAAASARRALGACESSLDARELAKRNVARRSRTVQQLRRKRGVTAGMKLSCTVAMEKELTRLIKLPRNGAVTWLLLRSGRPSTTTRPTFSTTVLVPPSR
jgi:hypothetical protein